MRQQGDSAAALDDGAALFRECTAPPLREGPRKGGPNKACLDPILSACRGWLDIHLCGRKTQTNKTGRKSQTKKATTNFGAWNVRTLMDADSRPERMTAIVGHELARYNIAVAALSETRRADTGCRLHLLLEWQNRDRTTCLWCWFCHPERHSLKPHLSSQRDLRPDNDSASVPSEQNTPDSHQCLCPK